MLEKFDVHSCWKAIKRILQEDKEDDGGIVLTQEDRGLLLESLSTWALNHKPKAAEPYKVSIPEKKLKATWHCIHVCLENDLFTEIPAVTALSRAMSLLAVELDYLEYNRDVIPQDPDNQQSSVESPEVEDEGQSNMGRLLQLP